MHQAILRGWVMRIAKPLLLATTPIGLIDGFYECYQLAGGLVFLMAAMVGILVVAAATVVTTIRREERALQPPPTDARRS
jgi:protein-S-isoprenylcysteine O-methyltransferase Ste14